MKSHGSVLINLVLLLSVPIGLSFLAQAGGDDWRYVLGAIFICGGTVALLCMAFETFRDRNYFMLKEIILILLTMILIIDTELLSYSGDRVFEMCYIVTTILSIMYICLARKYRKSSMHN